MQNNLSTYDIVVIGAGPAGLSAARTSARLGFRTLVVEQLAAPLRSVRSRAHGHAAQSMGKAAKTGAGDHAGGGLYFPQIDLSIPAALMADCTAAARGYGPAGHEVGAAFSGHDAPVALVDGPGVLNLLAGQTATAGGEFLFDTAAVGLLHEGHRVVGVRTTAGNVRAELVISAEGANRRLCEEAGLYGSALLAARYALVLTEEMDAPAVARADMGQIVTLGNRYTSAREAFGSVIMPAPGRAVVSFTVLAEDPGCATADAAWRFLEEYRRDPRVSRLLAGATVRGRTSRYVPFGEAPARVTADGFLGTGDAITPAGGLGLLPAVHVGRQAALIAAEAMDNGGASAARLAAYDGFCQRQILPGLVEESQALEALLALDDAQLDALGPTPGQLRLPLPNLGGRLTAGWEPISWSEQPPSVGVSPSEALAVSTVPPAYGWLKENALSISTPITGPLRDHAGRVNGFSLN
jgi:flavin-dependent dehydrogenase